MWLDKTVDYSSAMISERLRPQRPICGFLTSSLGWVGMGECHTQVDSFLTGFICKTPDARGGKNLQLLAPSPNLPQINVTTVGRNGDQWWSVICSSSHLTHAFLACDVATFCWAEGKIITSLRPDSWSVPTSQSCPAKLSSLPPYFLCQSEEQHVPYTLVCDHRPDCLDDSDERFCEYLSCQQEFQFQCSNKQVSVVCKYLYQESVYCLGLHWRNSYVGILAADTCGF